MKSNLCQIGSTIIDLFSYILHTPLTLPIFLQSINREFIQVNRSDFVSSSLVKDDPVCDDSEQGGQNQAGKVV